MNEEIEIKAKCRQTGELWYVSSPNIDVSVDHENLQSAKDAFLRCAVWKIQQSFSRRINPFHGPGFKFQMPEDWSSLWEAAARMTVRFVIVKESDPEVVSLKKSVDTR